MKYKLCVTLLKAKCPKCRNEAVVDEDMTKVRCSHCGFDSSYDSYLETMKGIAQNISDDYHANLNKSGL
ncbi:MAG TPA: zinc-domain-containing protein [Nitrososphaeraceae archaeon]|nr:zinc-domain-containing protein [Nitrososphaeraceae archaeon]